MCSVVFNFCMYVCMYVCCVFAPLPGKNGIADWFEVKFKIKSRLFNPQPCTMGFVDLVYTVNVLKVS